MSMQIRINYFFLLFFAFILLSSCENDEGEVKNLSSNNLRVEKVKGVNITYTIAGRAKALLQAPLMLRVQDTVPYVEFPDSVHVDFFNDSATRESKLDALYARYNENQAIVLIRDSVRVINMQKGDTLYCNELIWDRKQIGHEFYTDKPVRIRTRTQVIDGIGMESGQDFNNWHILAPRGTIQVPSSQFPD